MRLVEEVFTSSPKLGLIVKCLNLINKSRLLLRPRRAVSRLLLHIYSAENGFVNIKRNGNASFHREKQCVSDMKGSCMPREHRLLDEVRCTLVASCVPMLNTIWNGGSVTSTSWVTKKGLMTTLKTDEAKAFAAVRDVLEVTSWLVPGAGLAGWSSSLSLSLSLSELQCCGWRPPAAGRERWSSVLAQTAEKAEQREGGS